jgi:hypothetical protein
MDGAGGKIRGSLHCAGNGEAVPGFGRDDEFTCSADEFTRSDRELWGRALIASSRNGTGKSDGGVDFASFACYCEKVAMASSVFGRQHGKSAIHWKSNYTARLSGFLAFCSGR